MTFNNQDSIQLLNTAIIKSKEKKIDSRFEDRLVNVCSSPALEALSLAINHLSEKQKISRDHAAIQIVEAVRELDCVWNDYVLMEGITKLKDMLQGSSNSKQ